MRIAPDVSPQGTSDCDGSPINAAGTSRASAPRHPARDSSQLWGSSLRVPPIRWPVSVADGPRATAGESTTSAMSVETDMRTSLLRYIYVYRRTVGRQDL